MRGEMPPRDEQDYEAKRQQIIDGALEVFAIKGFEKATNKDIARAAGIGSPGLIYHYFKDKEDLFREVMEERAPALQFIGRAEGLMERPPMEVLTMFGQMFVKTLDGPVPMSLFKMILGEAVRRPAVAEMFNRIGPGRALGFLVRYISHQMELGNFKRMDPGAAARCFVGPLLAYILTREVFVQADAKTLLPDTMVATAVEVFLRGMEP